MKTTTDSLMMDLSINRLHDIIPLTHSTDFEQPNIKQIYNVIINLTQGLIYGRHAQKHIRYSSNYDKNNVFMKTFINLSTLDLAYVSIKNKCVNIESFYMEIFNSIDVLSKSFLKSYPKTQNTIKDVCKTHKNCRLYENPSINKIIKLLITDQNFSNAVMWTLHRKPLKPKQQIIVIDKLYN